MEDKLKKELQTNTLEVVDDISGGCISSSKSYLTDSGRVFIKFNKKEHAARMFNGEMEGLLAIVNTQTIRVPKPIK
ncbi:Ketosamine-3-kinase, partial [Trichoplax sp. H2]